jgi:uncharacterized membrane protein
MNLRLPGLSIRSWMIVRLALIGAALVAMNAYTVPLGPIAAQLQRQGLHLHALDLALLARQSLAVKLHITSALIALGVGTALLVGVKGRTFHKTAGWIWIAAMAVLVVSSVFIRNLNPGGFSYFHLLSAWTAVAIPMAVVWVRGGRIARHRRTMTGVFMGGLLIAGAFTFMPGRLMWRLFFG